MACLSCGSSTSLERQSAALFQAPDIHSKVMSYVASSNPHLFTLLLAFFPLRNVASGLWSMKVCDRNAMGNSVPSCSCDGCAPYALSDVSM